MNATDKADYRALCEGKSTIPLYSRAYWLDGVAGEDAWQVAVMRQENRIIAALPYIPEKKFGLKLLRMPPATQTMGLWIDYPAGQKYMNRLSFDMEMINGLLDQLPPYHYFNQRFHHTLTNWLPFYWRGFRQTTKYTYRIPDLSNLETVYNGIRKEIKSEIKKGLQNLTVELTDDFELFWRLHQMTFDRQKLPMPYPKNTIKRLDSVLASRGRRAILIAYNQEKRPIAENYIVWDDETMYAQFAGADPEFRKTDAMNLLLWKSIEFTKNEIKLNQYDFQGSMMPNIEPNKRYFGAVQTPYFEIYQCPSKVLGAALYLNGWRV